MLSYRHSFHAGNFADVLKHVVLIEILEHLTKKDSAFDYIDTHAGAGLYNLHAEHAAKLGEYKKGIGKLSETDWPELARYFKIISEHNKLGGLTFYPGSPLIATHFLRRQDRAWLFELHPKDFYLLDKNMAANRHIRISNDDGFKSALALLPPASRRGLVFIDPPYEVKTDYAQVPETVIKAYKKFATGIYAIWYPVVDRQYIEQLEKKLVKSGIKNIQRFELGIAGDVRGSGMTATGMIVINPPWRLMEKMSLLLPRLVAALGNSNDAFFKSDILVSE